MPLNDPKALLEERVSAIARFHQETGQARAELDVSGGVDSAVMLGLLVRAIGPEQVTAVFMDINSSEDSRARAEAVAQAFAVRLVVDDLSQEFATRIERMMGNLVRAGYDEAEIKKRLDQDPTILGSIRSCIRAPIGRGYNRITGGGIRHGTGNECEDRYLRFYQKGGDGEVDTNPIAMLSKGEVFQLGVVLGVPRRILEAMPSPDLWGTAEAHSDEAELMAWTGVAWTYSRVDPDTGDYTRVGTIERVSRYLDDAEETLFHGEDRAADELIASAHQHPALAPLDRDLLQDLLRSARRIEAITRHKLNPLIPELGTRSELVGKGIITNTLPQELDLEEA